MSKLYVADTCIFLDEIESLQDYKVVVLSHVLRELEARKSNNRDQELAYKARKAVRYIRENKDKFIFDMNDYDGSEYGNNRYEDNNILKGIVSNGYSLITKDYLLALKAKGLGVEVVELDDEDDVEEYAGYIEIHALQEEVNDIYQNLDDNKWDLLVNQYLIIKDDITGDVIDALKWNGQSLIRVNEKGFNTIDLGKFKPKDYYQQCALDSLNSNQMTVIKGKAGTGKSLIALNYAWKQIERGLYRQLIVFSNPVNAGKTSSKLGFYPGSRDNKLIDGNLGGILASKFGDKSQVEALILAEKLVLYPFADIRGVDIQNSIVWVVEAENLDVELLKIAIQRISESSKLIIDGDYNQVDADVFDGSRNGMRRMTEVFKGREMYGEIELKNVYRSRIAEIADLM